MYKDWHFCQSFLLFLYKVSLYVKINKLVLMIM